VGLSYTGDSMVADALGQPLYHKANEEDVFTIALDRKHLEETREKLPFWKDADPFILLNSADALANGGVPEKITAAS
jgi:omega-amidase